MPARNTKHDVFQHIAMVGADACWQWSGSWGGRSRHKLPYFMVEGRRYVAYRLVYELVHGECPDDKMVLHSCDHGSHPVGCCNPHHLRLGDVVDNSLDMVIRERHGLPTNVIKAIRRLLDGGRTQKEVAELYGISREAVSAIHVGRSYRNRGDRPDPNSSSADPPDQQADS